MRIDACDAEFEVGGSTATRRRFRFSPIVATEEAMLSRTDKLQCVQRRVKTVPNELCKEGHEAYLAWPASFDCNFASDKDSTETDAPQQDQRNRSMWPRKSSKPSFAITCRRSLGCGQQDLTHKSLKHCVPRDEVSLAVDFSNHGSRRCRLVFHNGTILLAACVF